MEFTNNRKEILGTDGKYWICSSGDAFGPRGKLKPTLMKIGYLSVSLSLGNGRGRKIYLHHLVAECFLGKVTEGLDSQTFL